VWLRALEVWLLVLAIAFANGALREIVLIPRLGEYPGHVISTTALTTCVILVAWWTVGWIGVASPAQAIAIGAAWVLCTLAFEFGAGHYIFGNPFERLLADYDLRGGRIWVLVLVATFFAPLWAFTQRHAG
jgi:hypothetical protein